MGDWEVLGAREDEARDPKAGQEQRRLVEGGRLVPVPRVNNLCDAAYLGWNATLDRDRISNLGSKNGRCPAMI